MDRDALRVMMKLVAESLAKEGPSFDPESVLSNYEDVSKAFFPAKPPGAAQRQALVADRHIEDVCRERDRMARELVELRETHALAIRELRRELTAVIDSHRARLDWFEPHYEGLKRDYDSIKAINYGSVAMLSVGGALMSWASFLTQDVPKFSVLAAGATATAYGLLTLGLMVYRSPAARERHEGLG